MVIAMPPMDSHPDFATTNAYYKAISDAIEIPSGSRMPASCPFADQVRCVRRLNT
jgi:hypothetical protein